ncbi:RLA class II histocompatibility antigen, DP alpha-1 chain-like [Scyliorhinus canicula]|uniref:RLA class II histocompatibility antigen, DP alpha-1 chain-like n=1 Tax=Scyliorhinus canicula TaxID=7830 RepID=UPI0018F751C9|nr:RLA class II histocompatibility antigen, DP alpha-1 chain-like [Scyliorhinus canicula]
MELWSCLIIISSLTAVTRAEIEYKSVSERLYYSYTKDAETNGHIFATNAFPFLFYDYKKLIFIIHGQETDGIKELGQEEVTHFKERASGIQAGLQGIAKEMTKLTNGSSVLKKKPVVHIYTEENYTPRQPNTLYCYVENFYPFEIDITILVNGRPFPGLVNSSQLVVEADWTFNILKYISIDPQDRDTYSCQVNHMSLKSPLTVFMDQSDPQLHIGTIVCAVGVIVGALGLMVGLYLVTKLCSRQGKPCSSQFCK